MYVEYNGDSVFASDTGLVPRLRGVVVVFGDVRLYRGVLSNFLLLYVIGGSVFGL